MRILYVENHARFAETVVEQFLGAHEVVVHPSIADARRATEHRAFDTVLVDYDLDDGKGDAFVRELRARAFDGRIVAVSAHERGNGALLDAGADGACPKGQMHRILEHL